MKKHIRNAIFGTIFGSLLLCAVGALIAKEPLKVGDYVAKQDAYYAGKADKQAFMNSSDYKVSFARERLFAWARHEGKEISLSNNTFVSSSFNATTNLKVYNTNASLVLLVVISLVGITSIGIVCHRRKEN